MFCLSLWICFKTLSIQYSQLPFSPERKFLHSETQLFKFRYKHYHKNITLLQKHFRSDHITITLYFTIHYYLPSRTTASMNDHNNYIFKCRTCCSIFKSHSKRVILYLKYSRLAWERKQLKHLQHWNTLVKIIHRSWNSNLA